MLVLLLKLAPIQGRRFEFRVRALGKWQGRVDQELAVVRRAIRGWFKFYVLAGTREHLLKDRDNGSEIIKSQLGAKPTNEFEEIIFHVGSSLFPNLVVRGKE